MDHHRMSSILPSSSSAVPGHSLHDSAVPSRVLQERCSNRQDDLSDSDYYVYRKGESLSPNDRAFYTDIRQSPYTGVKPRLPAEIIRDSNRLWHQLLRCKPYSKYRNRQPKDAPPNQDMKWPEHMEIAFCRGTSTCPFKFDHGHC
jgi:hypothetical protein